MEVQVGIVNKSPYPNPSYAMVGDSGMDIRAYTESPITLEPGKRFRVPTGLYFELPGGYEFQVRPRSGQSYKKGLTVINTPGTIDESYTGELGVLLINLGEEPITIEPGEKVAQLVLQEVPKVKWLDLKEITKITDRGDGAYGHTGNK